MKKVRFEEKSKLRGKFKDSSNFNNEMYIMRGFIMKESKISLVIVMLTTKDSSNFNRGYANYEEILNEKNKIWRKK